MIDFSLDRNWGLFFGKKEKKEKPTLLLDLGTETVKGIIFEKDEQRIKILASSLEYFDRYGIFDSQDFEKDVLKKTILKTIQNLNFDQTANKNIILGLPANILKARVISQNLKREKPNEIINEKEEKEIYNTIIEKTKKEILQIFSQESGILPKDIEFSNLKILKTKIDGYEVARPLKYKGKSLEFTILATFLPRHYLGEIKNIIESLGLKIEKIIHEAEGLSFYFDEIFDGIFLDIGGTITQIFLVKKGILEKIAEFYLGGQIFSKAISEKLGIRESEARILKERYSKKELTKESLERIKEILWFPLQIWFDNLKLKLKEMTEEGLFPSNIIIFGGGSQLPDIEEILKTGNWEVLSGKSRFKVQIFFPKNEKIEGINNLQEIPPLLIAHGQI